MKNGELREALLELERSRQKIQKEKDLAEAILSCLEVISDFETSRENAFEPLFEKMKKLISFDEVFLFSDDTNSPDFMRVIHSSNLNAFRPGRAKKNEYLKKIQGRSRNIFSIDKIPEFSDLAIDGALLIISFEIENEENYIVFYNSERSSFTKEHLRLGTQVSSLVKQAIINSNLIAKLIYSDKMVSVGEMAGGIAHEINNPLMIITASVNNLEKAKEENVLTDQMVNKAFDRIKSTVMRISRIISSLRTVSRQSDGSQKDWFEIREFIEDVQELSSERLKHNQVNFKLDLTRPCFNKVVYGDQVQLSQVLLNLVNNSFDAVLSLDQEDKWVEIACRDEKDFFVLSVVDSGHGIPTELQSKMFNPFFTSKEVGKGTGLGLSISLGIMNKMGGNLVYRDDLENTCFEIHIKKTEMSQ
ncbi:MAG: ATP-binding protein [Bdellovibrionota bacterium]|nr:ATP-binding protein [Bdellovibrionota bacterium]